MKPILPLSRREFLKTSAAATTAWSLGRVGVAAAEAADTNRFPIIAFSKPFQKLGPEETADLVAEVGWDGIECPVRGGGHILPDRVEEDLPGMVESLKKRGKVVGMITTDITRADEKARRVLETASKLGIKRYRLGGARYASDQSIAAQLAQLRPAMRDLAALNRELDIQGGWQNHSGAGTVGASVWDIYELLREIDPRHLGVCFDIGHATIEGGYSWPTEARLMEPYLAVVYLKDFTWQKSGKNWRANWCPLGEGMVNREFFNWLKRTQYRGPISQHHEYRLPSDRAELAAVFRKDLEVLRSWLS
jgi:sugar phosphate isomerase/epimerase